jgi:tetratricopeptide (TPR) repeat protein
MVLEDPEPGKGGASTVGRYIILGELGKGGMGVVYRVWDPALERTVALKMLLWGDLAGEEAHRRFLLESRAVAQLDHPGVVRVLDSGVHNGCPYFTMEYVNGQTLRARLEAEKTIPVEEAVRIVESLARTLHHAHLNGVVHRDIKPANILVDETGRPRISDFGIARLVAEGSSELTQAGQVLGTPAYMSPEQAAGLSNETGPRSDVYSLGALLYRLITGKLPFEDTSPRALLARFEMNAPSLRIHDPSLHPDLDVLCRKAMAPAVADRYDTADSLAEDAARFLRGEPVQASLPRLGRRLQWQLRKHRHQLLSVAGTLGLVAVLAVAWWGWVEHRAAEEQAAREAAAQRVLDNLQADLGPLWRDGREAEASRLLQNYLSQPEVGGTHAAVAARLFMARHELRAGRLENALEWEAQAYIFAEQPRDQLEVLAELSRAFAGAGARERLHALSRLMTRRQTETAARERLAEHQKTVGVLDRDLDVPGRTARGAAAAAYARLREQLAQVRETTWRADRVLPGLYARAGGSLAGGEAENGTAYTARPKKVGLYLASSAGGSSLPVQQLQEADAPAGTELAAPLFALGQLQNMTLLATTIYSPTTSALSSGIFTVQNGILAPLLLLPEGARLTSATFGDADGDGRLEYYLATGRRLQVVVQREEGGLRLARPVGALAGADSEVVGAFVADLDGDRQAELVVGLERWNAFDLRVFHRRLDGTFELLARRKVGALTALAPFPLSSGRQAILAVRGVAQELSNQFPVETPQGLAPGTWLLEYREGRLELLRHVPPPFQSARLERLTVGDFNQDGQSDFALQASFQDAPMMELPGEKQFMQLALGLGDNELATVTWPGLIPVIALQADADAAAELLVEETGKPLLLQLGAGGTPLQPLPPVGGDAGRAPGIETTDAPTWGRIEELLFLRLAAAAQPVMAQLAGTTIEPQAAARAFSRLGNVYREQARLGQAVEAFKRAAELDSTSPQALFLAAEVLAVLRRDAEELELRRSLLTRADLDAQVRQEQQRRIEQLKDRAERSWFVPSLTEPLEPFWRFPSPGTVLLQKDSLTLRATALPIELLKLAMDWEGQALSLEFGLEPRRLESAVGVVLELTPRGEGGAILALSVQRCDRAGKAMICLVDAASQTRLYEASRNDTGEFPALSVRLELDPQHGELSHEINGVAGALRVQPGTKLSGPLQLVVHSIPLTGSQQGLAELRLTHLRLAGVSAGRWPSVSTADRLEQLLVAGRRREVLESLADPTLPAGRRGLLSYVARCEPLQEVECRERLSELLRVESVDPARVSTLLLLDLRDQTAATLPPLLALEGRRALRRLATAWEGMAPTLPSDKAALERFAVGALALDTVALSPPSLPEQKSVEGTLAMARGIAWRRLEQPHYARRAFERVVQLDLQGIPEAWRLEGASQIFAFANAPLELAELALTVGKQEQARTLLRQGLARAADPLLFADQLLARVSLRGLLDEAPLSGTSIGALRGFQPVAYTLPSTAAGSSDARGETDGGSSVLAPMATPP